MTILEFQTFIWGKANIVFIVKYRTKTMLKYKRAQNEKKTSTYVYLSYKCWILLYGKTWLRVLFQVLFSNIVLQNDWTYRLRNVYWRTRKIVRFVEFLRLFEILYVQWKQWSWTFTEVEKRSIFIEMQ